MKPLHRSSFLTLCALTTALAAPLILAQPAVDGPPVAMAPEAPYSTLSQHDADMTPDGRTVVVSWERGLTRHVLRGRTLDADGRPGEPVPIAVYDDVVFSFGVPPAVAAAADGGFLAAWRDLRRPHVIRTRRFDGDGRSPGPNKKLTADDPWDFDLCAAGDGFVAAWTAVPWDRRASWPGSSTGPAGRAPESWR